MGRMIPVGIKDPFEMLPVGVFKFKITDAFEANVGKEGHEVYGVVIKHVVTEPASHAGMEHDETFFIGVDADAKQVRDGKLQADPNAELPETWVARGGMLKKYAARFDINIEGADMDVVLATITGKEVLGKVSHRPAVKDGQPLVKDDGTAMVNARVERWFSPGEVQPEIAANQAPAPATLPRQAAPGAGPRPAGQAAPVGSTAGGTATAAPPARPPLRRLGK